MFTSIDSAVPRPSTLQAGSVRPASQITLHFLL
jgi:hypothetical protein